MLAQIADIEMSEESKPYNFYSFNEEQRREYERSRRERLDRREKRRFAEYKRWGYYQRPGIWDKDLDLHQEDEHFEDFGDGIRILVARSDRFSWNGYVLLPETHPTYIDFTHYDDLENTPISVTYGGRGKYDCPDAPRGKYGFYNYGSDPYAQMMSEERFHYTSFDATREKCLELAKYFKELGRVEEGFPVLSPEDTGKKGRDLLLAVFKQIMESEVVIPNFKEFIVNGVGKSEDWRTCGSKLWKLMTPPARKKWEDSTKHWKLLVQVLEDLKSNKWISV